MTDGDPAARDPGSGEAGAWAVRGAWFGTEDRPLPPPSNTMCTAGGGSHRVRSVSRRAASTVASTSSAACSSAETAKDTRNLLPRGGRGGNGRSIRKPATAKPNRRQREASLSAASSAPVTGQEQAQGEPPRGSPQGEPQAGRHPPRPAARPKPHARPGPGNPRRAAQGPGRGGPAGVFWPAAYSAAALPRITVAWADSTPPLPCTIAVSAPATCRAPPSPRSCRTASISRNKPYMPGWQ